MARGTPIELSAELTQQRRERREEARRDVQFARQMENPAQVALAIRTLTGQVAALRSELSRARQIIDRIPRDVFFLDQRAVENLADRRIQTLVPAPFLGLDMPPVGADIGAIFVAVDTGISGGRCYVRRSGAWQTGEDLDSDPTCYADEIWDHTAEHKIISLNASQLWNDSGDVMLSWQACSGSRVDIGTSSTSKNFYVYGVVNALNSPDGQESEICGGWYGAGYFKQSSGSGYCSANLASINSPHWTGAAFKSYENGGSDVAVTLSRISTAASTTYGLRAVVLYGGETVVATFASGNVGATISNTAGGAIRACDGTWALDITGNVRMESSASLYFGTAEYKPTTVGYTDDNGDPQSMTILAKQ